MKDAIVYEMVRNLLVCVVAVFWHLLNARYCGDFVENIGTRRWILLIFLPKTSVPNTLKDFRGICLTSVISKWYMSSIILLAKCQPTQVIFQDLGIFAYKEGMSCLDVLLPLHLLFEAGFEWRLEMGVCIASGDVMTAFDSLTVDQACQDMIASGLHPQLVASIAEENCNLQLQPSFPDCADMGSIHFNKSIRQGVWNPLFAGTGASNNL